MPRVPMSTLVMMAILLSAAAPGVARPEGVQDEAQIKHGQEVYTAQKCQVCHAIAGKGNKQNPLDGVGKKLAAEDLRKWITSPDEMTAKAKSTKKPPMPKKWAALPAADLDALVAYLQTLK